MFTLIFIFCALFSITLAENICEKLTEFGDNIENKALLSPIVIKGKGGMKLDLPNEQYKLTIEIIKIIKGSLGEWKKPIIVAGAFSIFQGSRGPCEFQSDPGVEQFYFLQAISEGNGEYKVIFHPEIVTNMKLDRINKIICNECGKAPTIAVTDLSERNHLIVDCISYGNPIPVVKWEVSKPSSNVNIIPIKNGERLAQFIKNSSYENYVCKAKNVIGNASYGIFLKTLQFKSADLITRCSTIDKVFCNGHGKCYEDKLESQAKFCRCDAGYNGQNCENPIIKLQQNVIQQMSSMDSTVCNNNGEGFKNLKTGKEYCICNSIYFGARCEKKVTRKTIDNDEADLRKFVEDQTNKLAVKYIVIGCLIVLAGCISVIVVILIVWKCFLLRCTNKHIGDDEEEEEEKLSENNQLIAHNYLKPVVRTEENNLLITNIDPMKMQNNPKPPCYNIEVGFKGNDSNLSSGNGIYDDNNIYPSR